MAISPKDVYPGQVDGTDPAYPYGKARNIVVAGDGGGTPFEKTWLNDAWGFFQALLQRASATPSGQPDKVGASQYVDAINWLVNNLKVQENTWTGINKFLAGYVANNWGVQGEVLYCDAAGAVIPKPRTVRLDPYTFVGLRDQWTTDPIIWHSPEMISPINGARGVFPLAFPSGTVLVGFRATLLNLDSADGTFAVKMESYSEGSAVNTLGNDTKSVTAGLSSDFSVSGALGTMDRSTLSYCLTISTGTATGRIRVLSADVDVLDPGPRSNL